MSSTPNFYLQYFLPYIILILLVFIIIYWGFNNSITEAECLSISLIIGMIYLSIRYRDIVNTANLFNPATRDQVSNIITINIVIITFSTLFIFMTGMALLTFNRHRILSIFYI